VRWKTGKEVLKLIAKDIVVPRLHPNGITVATVEAHRRNILRKLQLHSAADLIAMRYVMG